VEELAGQLIEFGGGLHPFQGQVAQRDAHCTEQHRQAQRQQQTLQQDLPQRRAIVAPGGLGGETGGAHAQKPHGPGQEGIQAAPDRHGAQLVGVGQVADDHAVDQGHQRYRDVRQDHRRGQGPDAAVGGAVAPVGQ